MQRQRSGSVPAKPRSARHHADNQAPPRTSGTDGDVLLDMLTVLDEERRYNKAAARLAPYARQREGFARKAECGNAEVSKIRRKIANRRARLPMTQAQINACIDRLIDVEVETGRSYAATLDRPADD